MVGVNMKMTEPEIEKVISEAFHSVAPEITFSEIDLNKPLRTQVDIDSFDFYKLLLLIENSTGTKISERTLKELNCLADLIHFLEG
jgi:acyl carrier protein